MLEGATDEAVSNGTWLSDGGQGSEQFFSPISFASGSLCDLPSMIK